MNETDSHKSDFFHRVIDLYVDGFKNMTVGKKLWLLIIIKLIVIFLVLKIFFFPDILKRDYDSDDERANAVRKTLISR